MDYVQKMKGIYKDLAANVRIINHKGKVLYGKEIKEVFSDVSKQDYFDSIWFDVEGEKEGILDNAMYFTLNLLRVLAYPKNNLILSKKEGGEWGFSNLPKKYQSLIILALDEYASENPSHYIMEIPTEYVEYGLKKYKNINKILFLHDNNK